MKPRLQYTRTIPPCCFIRHCRILGFFTLLLVSFTASQAQTSQSYKEENFDVRLFAIKSISIPAATGRFALSNFNGIEVIDARADTSRVGCMQKRIATPVEMALTNGRRNRIEQRVTKKPTFLKLAAGVRNEAAQYARKLLSFAAQDSLPQILMVIKKLWLTDELLLNNQHVLVGDYEEGPGKDRWTSGIDIRVEFYLQNQNAYYPLYRFDSVITTPMTISEYGPEFIASALQLSLQKMQQVDKSLTAIYTRHRFNLQEIAQHNQKEYSIPVLQDSVIKQGIYMSFEEFKNNHPSHQDFVIKKERLSDILYIKQTDGREYVERKVWGYCNGKNIYVKTGENFFLLQRMENAFYVFGIHCPAPDAGGALADSNRLYANYSARNIYGLPLKPFQLDWTTGLLY